jgi:hypothetical protein
MLSKKPTTKAGNKKGEKQMSKEHETELTIRLDVVVTDEDIDDIMDTVGYAINYWANCMDVVGDYLGEYASEQISRGGTVKIHLVEPIKDGGATVYELTKEKFMKGLRKYLQDPCSPYNIIYFNDARQRMELDTGNADAVVCDMIIQYALFDEIVFA